MTIGIVGRKCGMTRVFTDDGQSVPVTVIEASPNKVTQVKSADKDGYKAIQVAVGTKKASHISKPESGHFSKAEIEGAASLHEFRLAEGDDFDVGAELSVEQFSEGQMIDATGTSKGKGFAGGVKRWNFSMQDATHGNSLSHRAPGSIGQCQTPGRVFKGKKMAGHMGAAQVTTQNLRVVKVDAEKNLILVRGAVAGAPGGKVILKPAVKAADTSN